MREGGIHGPGSGRAIISQAGHVIVGRTVRSGDAERASDDDVTREACVDSQSRQTHIAHAGAVRAIDGKVKVGINQAAGIVQFGEGIEVVTIGTVGNLVEIAVDQGNAVGGGAAAIEPIVLAPDDRDLGHPRAGSEAGVQGAVTGRGVGGHDQNHDQTNGPEPKRQRQPAAGPGTASGVGFC